MLSTQCEETARLIAERACQLGIRIGCAESLTSGAIATYLGAAPNATEWFAGGIISYGDDVKRRVLGVRQGPVVTPTCASEMAAGAAALLRVHHAVAVTGVGGPDSAEGKPPGTVYVGLATGSRSSAIEIHLAGDPEDVVAETTYVALRLLLSRIGGKDLESRPAPVSPAAADRDDPDLDLDPEPQDVPLSVAQTVN